MQESTILLSVSESVQAVDSASVVAACSVKDYEELSTTPTALRRPKEATVSSHFRFKCCQVCCVVQALAGLVSSSSITHVGLYAALTLTRCVSQSYT